MDDTIDTAEIHMQRYHRKAPVHSASPASILIQSEVIQEKIKEIAHNQKQ